jgi:hypothetical protein
MLQDINGSPSWEGGVCLPWVGDNCWMLYTAATTLREGLHKTSYLHLASRISSLLFTGLGETALTRTGEAAACIDSIDFITCYYSARSATRIFQSLMVSTP